ncbi:MAG: hypothetical protein Q9213_007624 [Squamulea squamosa]
MDASTSIKPLIERISILGPSDPDGSLQPHTRKELQSLVKKLGFALESPFETLNRLVVLPFQHAVVRVAIDLGLFEYLVEAGESGRTIKDIRTKTGVDATLLPTQGPLQDTYDTKLAGWEYILEPKYADSLQDCNKFMKGRREGSVSWLEFYPFAENTLAKTAVSADTVLVVDVGGGLGHGLVEIKEKYPEATGRLILQDHPKTIDQAGNGAGVFEPMAHDFFTPQPIQAPKMFLIRQVLHDWPDLECQKILKNLAAAMRPRYSKLLINEFVVDNVGASDFIVAIDLVMMGMSGGMERTMSQWTTLLASAGLRIEKIWTLNGETESVIEAVLDTTLDSSENLKKDTDGLEN